MSCVQVTQEEWDCRLKEVDTHEVQEFMDWLQGECEIERMTFDEPPKLSKEAAFSVIYYLQEWLGIMSDNYELCRECGSIYDSDNEGTCIDSDTTLITESGEEVEANFTPDMYGFYCDNCRPD